MQNDADEDEMYLIPTGRPTLQEIARETYCDPEYRLLTEATIAAALVKAGIDPANEKERERFRRLALAATHTTETDAKIAWLGDRYDPDEED